MNDTATEATCDCRMRLAYYRDPNNGRWYCFVCNRHAPDAAASRDETVTDELHVIAESFPGATQNIQTLAEHAGGWTCEQHPDLPFPHDECPGPGRLPEPTDSAAQRASEATWQHRSTSPSSPKPGPSSHGSSS